MKPLRTITLPALLAVGLAAGVVGCGDDDDDKAPVILNTEGVERAIEKSFLDQRDIRSQVSCPSGTRQRKGENFICTAKARKRTYRFAVTQVDDNGNVTYAGK